MWFLTFVAPALGEQEKAWGGRFAGNLAGILAVGALCAVALTMRFAKGAPATGWIDLSTGRKKTT
jgi:hypothetical protein